MNGVSTAVLISDFTLHLRGKNTDVPDIYFTLLDAAGISPSLVFNQNAEAKEEAGSLWKFERQKLQKLYTQGAATYGSVHNLAKASRLPVSKVRQLLHSKASYEKFTLAARKFKRKRAFARFRNETWCIDLAFIDNLAEEINGVKFLLVRQDLFDRTVKAEGMKTKDPQETVKAFSSMTTKRNRSKKIWVDKGTEFAGAFKMFCTAKGIQVYSTMSETKAAFAERTIRSLKNFLYQ